MNRLFKFIIIISLLACPAFGAEQIVDFEEDSLPILNNELDGLTVENQIKSNDGLDLQSRKITSLATPVATTDAANKAYVDAKTGTIVQVVNVQTGAVDTGTTAMTVDDDIPQITDGDEYMTLAITPTSATNKLKIEVVVNGKAGGDVLSVMGLFQDTTANALAAVFSGNSSSRVSQLVLIYYMTAGTTSSTTFRVRAGSSTGTYTFNGQDSNRKFGGVMASSITITEVVV